MTEKKKNVAALILVILLTTLIGFGIGKSLPSIGDATSPANSYLSDYYITHAEEDTNSPNLVTAVLADYRGFDTLFETCVLFLSGVVVWLTLNPNGSPYSNRKKQQGSKVQKNRHLQKSQESFSGLVLNGSFRIIIPVLLIYAVYVLAHGELSLGGGFQAGAIIASAYLLMRLINGRNSSNRIKGDTVLIIAGIGTFIYALTGILCLINGGNFLEYGMLPFGAQGDAHLHSTGILMIETGVTICVTTVIISILEAVLERTQFDD